MLKKYKEDGEILVPKKFFKEKLYSP